MYNTEITIVFLTEGKKYDAAMLKDSRLLQDLEMYALFPVW